jgi:hypothetical protein
MGLIKKDIEPLEARRRGWEGGNTNYGHSLSLKEGFVTHAAFHDVQQRFIALGAVPSNTTPCGGLGYYATRFDFNILQSIAFFLVQGFEVHLEPDFLEELPDRWRDALGHLQQRLSQNPVGWDERLKTIEAGSPDPLQLI